MAEVNKIRVHRFTVVMGTNRKEKLIPSSSILEEKGVVVTHIRTRRAGTNRRSLLGKEIVGDTNFEAASITLKIGQEHVADSIALEHIEDATKTIPCEGYPLYLKGIDWAQSHVEVEEGVALDADKVFEFSVSFYRLPAGK